MKPSLSGIATVALSASALTGLCPGAVPLTIESGTQIHWASATGFEYQLQVSSSAKGAGWRDVGARVSGTGKRHSLFHPGEAEVHFRLLRLQPGFVPKSSLLTNGSFEKGGDTIADGWHTGGSQPFTRSRAESCRGSSSMHCKLVNEGTTPREGLLSQVVRTEGGEIVPDSPWILSFQAKTISAGPSYLQQYHLAWRDKSGQVLAAHPFTLFKPEIGRWRKISAPRLLAPPGAVEALIRFRFVTGAVANGHGETYLDDVLLTSGHADPSQVPTAVEIETSLTSRLSWPTRPNWIYLPFETTIAPSGSRSSLVPTIKGDGSTASVTLTRKLAAGLRAALPAALSLLAPGDLSAEQSGDGGLSLSWKSHEDPQATYRILHGRRPGLLSEVINTGFATTGVIPDVKAGETRSFAILVIHSAAP